MPAVKAKAKSPRGGAGRRKVPRAEREEQILTAALRAFAERGYDRASMDEVAAEVGVTKPMIYAYFGSKDGLYVAALARAIERLNATVEHVVGEGETPELRMWNGIVAFFEFIEEHRDGWRLLYTAGGGGDPKLMRKALDARSQSAAMLTRMFREVAEFPGATAPPESEVEAVAHVFMGACESLALRWVDHPEEPKELQALRLMNIMYMGFGRLSQGELWVPPDGGVASA